MMIGILYLSQFRAGLIDARIQSLMIQGEIIANAVAASGTVDPDGATIDPQRLLELQLGETYDPAETGNPGLDFPINPVRVAPVLQRLVSPTNTRARIYERDGTLHARQPRALRRAALRPAAAGIVAAGLHRAAAHDAAPLARRAATCRPIASSGRATARRYEEVAIALTGLKSSMVRINERAEVIVSVAVPVTRFRAVRGALCSRPRAPKSTTWSPPSGSRCCACSCSRPA